MAQSETESEPEQPSEPEASTERSIEGPRHARGPQSPAAPRRRVRRGPWAWLSRGTWFDVLGALAVAAFVVVVLLDVRALGRPRQEVSLHVDPEALAEGFREGVQWYGLYRGEHKVGFSRTERRRLGDGVQLRQEIHLRADPDRPGFGLGRGPTKLAIDTELDEAFVLRRFTVEVEGGPMPLRATGERRDAVLHIEAEGLPGTPVLDLPLAQPPVFDFSLGPLVMRRDLAPGDRFAFTHVDPLGLIPSDATLEYLGRAPIDVLGERVSAHHLRESLPGTPPLSVWVNDLGEVLQQELPLALLAVREAEAEATYGMLAPREPSPPHADADAPPRRSPAPTTPHSRAPSAASPAPAPQDPTP